MSPGDSAVSSAAFQPWLSSLPVRRRRGGEHPGDQADREQQDRDVVEVLAARVGVADRVHHPRRGLHHPPHQHGVLDRVPVVGHLAVRQLLHVVERIDVGVAGVAELAGEGVPRAARSCTASSAGSRAVRLARTPRRPRRGMPEPGIALPLPAGDYCRRRLFCRALPAPATSPRQGGPQQRAGQHREHSADRQAGLHPVRRRGVTARAAAVAVVAVLVGVAVRRSASPWSCRSASPSATGWGSRRSARPSGSRSAWGS